MPDLGPPAVPQAGRIAVAKLEAGEDHVLVSSGAEQKDWVRVAGGSDLQSSDRLVCLPGYRTKLKFDGGLTAELWGNLPELLAFRVLETAVTLHIAPKGYDAEMTLHTGRIYFNTNKPEGAKIRVRFAKEIWDIALADAKSEAVLELAADPAPGRPASQPQSTAVLSTISGTTRVTIRKKELPPIPPKQIVLWMGRGGEVGGPRAPDPKRGEPDTAYFDRFAVFPNEGLAKPARSALDKFAKKLPPGKSVLDRLTETQQVEKAALSDETVAGSRFSLYSFAALGELARVVDAVNDSERPYCRMVAIRALRSALGTQPGLEAGLVKLAAEKLRMDAATADKWVFRLRGLTAAERIDPAILDELVEGLTAPDLAERELDFFLISNAIDPASLTNRDLMAYDAGATADRLEAAARLWKRRIEDVKEKMKNMPEKRVRRNSNEFGGGWRCFARTHFAAGLRLHQRRGRSRAEIGHIEFDARPALPLVDFGREGQRHIAAAGGQFVEPVAAAERHRAEDRLPLAHPELQVPLALAHLPREPFEFQSARQKLRPRVLGAVGFQSVDLLHQPLGVGPERHFGVEPQPRPR